MSYNIAELVSDQLYSGASLFTNVDLSNKDQKSFTKQLKDNIKLLSKHPGQGTIFGSYNYSACLYPGDIDLHQEVKYHGTRERVIELFHKAYVRTIKEIHATPDHFVGETKSGYDYRFALEIGKLINGKILSFNDEKVKSQLSLLFDNNLLDDDEYQHMINLVNNINVDNHDELREILRNLFTVRWSYEEVIKGSKVMRGGLIKSFNDALNDKTLIKFDIHLQIGGKYIEMSNHFMVIQIHKDGSEEFINLPQNYLEDFKENLKYEVEKLYYNKQFMNLIKYTKRIFSIARLNNDKTDKTPYIMLQLLNSDAGILYQIKSDLDTIITMLEYIKNPPIDALMKQLDNTKMRMANITEIPINSDEYYKKITYIVSNYKRLKLDTIINALSNFKSSITNTLNKFSFVYLATHKYAPPPRHFLPIVMKYKY